MAPDRRGSPPSSTRSARAPIGIRPRFSLPGTIGAVGTITPSHRNTISYELGFRVPLLVISPYAKRGYVSKRRHEFGSILKFIEATYGLGSLGTTDARSDDLSDCFTFGQAPRRFSAIAAPLGSDYFANQPITTENPDDDQ